MTQRAAVQGLVTPCIIVAPGWVNTVLVVVGGGEVSLPELSDWIYRFPKGFGPKVPTTVAHGGQNLWPHGNYTEIQEYLSQRD